MRTVNDKTLLPNKLNPKACHPAHNIVVYSVEGEILREVETHNTAAAAQYAVGVLNGHATRYNLTIRYEWAYAPNA